MGLSGKNVIVIGEYTPGSSPGWDFLSGVASQYELANVFGLTFIAEHIIFNVS